MNRIMKTLPVCLAAVLGSALPYSAVRAEDSTTTVTTPSERYNAVVQSTPDQRQQQYLDRAQQAQQTGETLKSETPDQRHQSYQQSAQQAQSQAQAKANAASQSKQNWSQMSAQEHQQAIETGKQNVQSNMNSNFPQMQDMTRQRSGYGYSGYGGRR